MTAPVLKVVAEQLEGEGAPSTLILSGLLHSELDETAAVFAPLGFAEADRRLQGDWAALLLRS
jgi:ribosomal protein L11 methyltransferase